MEILLQKMQTDLVYQTNNDLTASKRVEFSRQTNFNKTNSGNNIMNTDASAASLVD